MSRVVEAASALSGTRSPLASLDSPAALGAAQDGGTVDAEHPAQAVEHRVGRGRSGQPRECLGLGAGAGSLRCASRSEVDEHADHCGDGEEDDEREDVLALADRERVERRREVPVDEQEAADRSDERRQEPADGRDADDEQQEEEQDARQADFVSQLGQDDRQGGRRNDRNSEPDRDPAPRQRRGATGARQSERLFRGIRMADDVDVDPRARAADDLADHRSSSETLPARAPARAHDDLRHVQRAGSLEQRVADVLTDHFAVGAAELRDELTLPVQQHRGRSRQPILRNHVHSDELTSRPLRHPSRSSNQALAVGRARESDEHALPRLPWLVDAVSPSVVLEALVDSIRQPGEGELTQRGEVPRPEVVGKRGIDALGRIDVAPGEPVAERKRCQVDELELVRPANDLVGNRLALLDAGDLLDDVVQRLQVLNVEGRDDVDAGLEQLRDVLPALLVAGTWRVGVCELVDERDLRPPFEQGVDVHLLDRRPPILDRLAWNHFQAADLLGRLGSPVCLDVADDDVLAVFATTLALVEHRVRLADARCGAEVDAQLASSHSLKATPGRGRGSARGR